MFFPSNILFVDDDVCTNDDVRADPPDRRDIQRSWAQLNFYKILRSVVGGVRWWKKSIFYKHMHVVCHDQKGYEELVYPENA